MAWVYLVFAGVLEIVWAFSMKQSEGFSKLVPSVKTLPLGTAYTIWTGIGAVGAFVIGIHFLGEPLTALRVVAAVLIVSGLVLMKLSS